MNEADSMLLDGDIWQMLYNAQHWRSANQAAGGHPTICCIVNLAMGAAEVDVPCALDVFAGPKL